MSNETMKPRPPESTPRPLDQPGTGYYPKSKNLDQPGKHATSVKDLERDGTTNA